MHPPDTDHEALRQGHAVHLEETLLQAHALIESTVSLYRRQPATSPPTEPTGAAVLDSALCQLISGVRHSLSVAMTGPGDFSDCVLRLLTPVGQGVAVRVLCTPEAAEASVAELRRLPEARLEVRVSERELREVVVADGAGALVRAPGEGDAQQATVVKDAAAVRALELLFAGTWTRGRRLADHLGLSPRLRTELTRKILDRLRAGHTDDVAARDLNVSLRTYRRHVAEIMRELDANSRFQAGVRAVELGLLAA
ncbi:DNA-binding response regulator [Streptomyces sp. NPDC003023]|uniref:helix-turn-helix transcriptional regulator n=1 Tax=Streptomyces sp. NPDC003023 TaxID=3364675 RepID=UPI0036B03D32